MTPFPLIDNALPEPGNSLLRACGFGRAASIRALLAEGANPNEPDEHGRHPLWWAAKNGRLDCVAILIEAGADLDARDYAGRGALSMACGQGNAHVAHALVRAGASPHSPDALGRTPLIWAACFGRLEAVAYLLGGDPRVDARDDEGLSALSHACLNDQAACAEALLLAGADPGPKTGLGCEAAELARGKGHHETAQFVDRLVAALDERAGLESASAPSQDHAPNPGKKRHAI